MPSGNNYTYHHVRKLLGFPDKKDPTRIVITMLDIISWMQDPGGDSYWGYVAEQENPQSAWQAKRGPIPQDGTVACIYYDFQRGMRNLNFEEQAVVWLTVGGFDTDEISKLLHLQPTDIHRMLFGTKDEHGAISNLAAGMNGRKKRRKKIHFDPLTGDPLEPGVKQNVGV
jgi:hypothetical protein